MNHKHRPNPINLYHKNIGGEKRTIMTVYWCDICGAMKVNDVSKWKVPNYEHEKTNNFAYAQCGEFHLKNHQCMRLKGHGGEHICEVLGCQHKWVIDNE